MFPGAGTALNCATVIVGGSIGLAAGQRIPVHLRDGLFGVLGLFTCIYGVKTAILPGFTDEPAPDLAIVLLAMIAGVAIGTLCRFHDGLEAFGRWVETRVSGGRRTDDHGRIARAFVTTSLLFCVGPLTILGSFNDGSHGDILLLGIKASLDGVAAMAFAATLGGGVLLSAVSVFVVQGSITAVAYFQRNALDHHLVTQALGAGGLMLLAIGLGLLEIRRTRVADMLPALALAPLFAEIVRSLHWAI